MGTAGTALFSDDVACDVRDEFAQMLSAGVGEKVATRVLVHSRAAAIDDVDDGPVFWLALAATQWKYGCLSKQVQAKALGVIDKGSDLHRWEGAALARRRAVLAALKEKLLSPQPASRRPPRRKPVVVPSTKVLAPDEQALATAYELGDSSLPDAPRMQVTIEMIAAGGRGGGGVFVASCKFTDVSLKWLDSETLRVSYPASAVVNSQSASMFYCGRTVYVAYEVKAI